MPSFSAWFPRLSPSGRRLASGHIDLTVDGAVVPDGLAPQWPTEDSVVYVRNSDGRLMKRLADGTVLALDARGGNSFTAAGAYWGVFHAASKTTRWSHWPEQQGVSSPAVNGSGARAWLEYDTGRLFVENLPVDERPCLEPHWSLDTLVYRAHDGRDVCAYNVRTQAQRRGLNVEPREYWPVPLQDSQGELWLLTHGEARLLLRPLGGRNGYVVAADANTHYPDARFIDANTVRVVWSTSRGELRERAIDIRSPRDSLTAPTNPKPPDPPVDPPVLPPACSSRTKPAPASSLLPPLSDSRRLARCN